MTGAKVTGDKALIAVLEKLRKEYPAAFAAGIYQEGLAIDAESVKEVPVKSNRLRGSHYVSPPTDANNPTVEVGYGTDYGIYVHEMTELHHDNGKAKFLSDPVDRARNGYLRRLAARTIANQRAGVGLDLRGSAPTQPTVDPAHAPQDNGASNTTLPRTRGRK
jgi:hypothetical protein